MKPLIGLNTSLSSDAETGGVLHLIDRVGATARILSQVGDTDATKVSVSESGSNRSIPDNMPTTEISYLRERKTMRPFNKGLLRRVGLVLTMTCVGYALHSNEISADEGTRTMKVLRIYTGADNKSHFEDLLVPMKDSGKIGFMSELTKATGVVFRETSGDYNYDFHPAPRRQYVVNLEGEVEIEVGDGTRRILRTGDILLAEDTTGQGHISRAVAGKPRRSLFITLD